MEKRDKLPPIPENYTKLLTELQLMSLRNTENFGWTLNFIRRENIDVPVIVIKGPNGKSIGIIDEDGSLNMNPDIQIRE